MTERPALLLVRHGKAQDDHPAGDDARALTEEGRRQFRRDARRLARRVHVTAIATSPLVRAVQTAEILAEAWGVGEVVVRPELAFDGPGATAIEAMARALGAGWALVGHNPSMAEALGRMTAARETPGFRKGAVVALDRRDDRWSVRWTANPGKKAKSGK